MAPKYISRSVVRKHSLCWKETKVMMYENEFESVCRIITEENDRVNIISLMTVNIRSSDPMQ